MIPTPPPTAAPRADRQQVLVVDDDPAVALAVERSLVRKGHEVLICSSNDALRLIVEERFKAIVSDLHMPGADGLDLLSVARAYDEDVPFILVTGFADQQSAIDAINFGADKYLTKPLSLDSISDAIDQCIRRRRDSERRTSPGEFDIVLGLIRPVFQPIVSTNSGRTVAYEALLRSNHPVFDNPGRVIDFAERCARVRDLGRGIRKLAVEAFHPPNKDARLFVNLHAQELFDPQLISRAEPMREIAGRIVLEITERENLTHLEDLKPRLRALRELGFQIAIDDLGSGYSGLASLVHMEPDYLKLDMSLVRGIEKSVIQQKIIESIAKLSDSIGVTLVAEGIETQEENAMLRSLGCDWMQGYFFGRPSKNLAEVID